MDTRVSPLNAARAGEWRSGGLGGGVSPRDPGSVRASQLESAAARFYRPKNSAQATLAGGQTGLAVVGIRAATWRTVPSTRQFPGRRKASPEPCDQTREAGCVRRAPHARAETLRGSPATPTRGITVRGRAAAERAGKGHHVLHTQRRRRTGKTGQRSRVNTRTPCATTNGGDTKKSLVPRVSRCTAPARSRRVQRVKGRQGTGG